MSVTIVGLKELQRELDKMEPGPLNKTLQKGMTASGKFLKPHVQAAAPRGKTGKLKKSVSARQARRQKPGAIISARPKVAFYRHMVIGGTKPHRIRFPDQRASGVGKGEGNIYHPGAKAQPFISRTADRFEEPAAKVAMDAIKKELP
jgi:hypothetical protein